ncbi:hypothetical protein BABINDRAFT_164082 [Babjeviella inositovora NRRL Y-12698]|uniref:Uncharacterized protein n=1 Tax=Babjeviella inositovora NRRL Y-12698 TaxID=984486 RepID=A0A1E3QXD6_9ASCO|nr:uncharacterized protein BABINDRAFT_164082 [Babjeviella inositovora NRRL Y-12698]ODQ82271.1 hypothetical protein BABINDRAFT_164082 [Babjeviella inositovora NRRL Y-12698]
MTQSTDLEIFQSLNETNYQQLSLIPDYPLDFNLFIFRGISQRRGASDTNDSNTLLADLPVEQLELMVPSDGNKTFVAHQKLLKILIVERMRRDLTMINAERHRLDENVALQSSKEILQRIAEEYLSKESSNSPLLDYQIRSPIYNMLDKNPQDSYKRFFQRMAQLQALEFKFETDMEFTDNEELIEMFLNDDILDFNKNFVPTREQIDAAEGSEELRAQMEIREKAEQAQRVEQMFSSEIVRVMIPLAAQAVLTGVKLSDIKNIEDLEAVV